MEDGYLCLNGSIRTDVESVEDHIEVAGGGGHEEEEEVEVGEGEQPVLVDRVQEVAAVHLFAHIRFLAALAALCPPLTLIN